MFRWTSYSLNRYTSIRRADSSISPSEQSFLRSCLSFSLDFEGEKTILNATEYSISPFPHPQNFRVCELFQSSFATENSLPLAHFESLTSILHMFSVPWIMHSCQTAISFDQGQFYRLQSRKRFYSPSSDFGFFTAPFLEVKISFGSQPPNSLPTIPTISATRHYPPFLQLMPFPFHLIPSRSRSSKHPKNSNYIYFFLEIL